jgi:site-specific recombinase XerD
MTKSTPPFTKSRAGNTDLRDSLPAPDVARLLDSWLLACDIERHSERTIESRRERVGRLVWFLPEKGHESCGLSELRAFFHYLNHGHKDKAGRWGAGDARSRKPLSSGRVKSYHSSLRTFFNWLVAEGELDTSPMERIPVPVDRADQVQPFTDEQVKALIAAARRTKNPLRDEALLLLMLDTGLRASEVSALRCQDCDLTALQVAVWSGKGGKARHVPFSRDTRKTLYAYLRSRVLDHGDRDAPLFAGERGTGAGDAIKRGGLLRIFRRLARAAKVDGVRCSPHTMRHTFAVSFLRAGGNVFTLKMMLGHESLAMVNRYVALSQADVTRQHAQFSPVARLKAK